MADEHIPSGEHDDSRRTPSEIPGAEFILTILLLLGFLAAMAVLTLYI